MKDILKEVTPELYHKTTLKSMLGNEKRRLQNQSVKYYIFTTVIDYLAFSAKVPMTIHELMRVLDEQAGYDYMCIVNAAQIELWLRELSIMNVIVYDRDARIVQITDKGMEMYRNQTYHSIYASILEAKHSRKIAQKLYGFLFSLYCLRL